MKSRFVVMTWLTAALLGTALTISGTADAARHSTLVDPARTNCTSCHDEVLRWPVKHAPATSDCLSCHQFTARDEGLAVTLVAAVPELCLSCHDDLGPAAAGSLKAPHPPVADDCTTCHSPHSAAQERLLVASPGDLCATCHEAAATDTLHPIPVSRGRCLGCHSAHGSGVEHMLSSAELHTPFGEGSCDACHRKPRGTRVLLQLEGAKLCFACHGELEETLSAGHVHTAVRQGRCLGCHDPHLGASSPLLREAPETLCFSCHPEVERKVSGPGAHAAVADGCATCHDAHRSEHAAQLADEPTPLCLGCHDGKDAHLVRAHLGADLSRTACTECHDPHGSEQPHLVAGGSVHPPFLDDCGTCHQGSAGKLAEGGGTALCVVCHADVQERARTAKVPHGALEAGTCEDCHSPHASSEPHLLRAAGSGLCTPCHEDKVPAVGQVSHGAIEWLGCQSCHLPHGADSDALLRTTGNVLCNGCHLQGVVRRTPDGSVLLADGSVLHRERAKALKVIDLDPSRQRDHPLPNHPVGGLMTSSRRIELVGSVAGTTMSCRSCHVPHAAPSRGLLANGAASPAELCRTCHPK